MGLLDNTHACNLIPSVSVDQAVPDGIVDYAFDGESVVSHGVLQKHMNVNYSTNMNGFGGRT